MVTASGRQREQGILAVLRGRLGTGRAVAIWMAVYLVSQAAIAAIIDPLGPLTVLRAQTTFDAERYVAFVRAWEAAGLLDRYRHHYLLDFVHPIWYGMMLCAALAWGLERRRANDRWNILLLLPFAAGAMDELENVCHLIFLADLDHVSSALVALSAAAATTKWTLATAASVLGASLALAGRSPPLRHGA